MKNIYLLLIVFAFAGTGCSSMRSVKDFSSTESIKSEMILNYEIGKPRQIYVGDKIIEKGKVVRMEEFFGEYKGLRDVGYIVNKGKNSKVIHVDENDGSYYVASLIDPVSGVRINPTGELLNEYQYYYNLTGWQNNLLVKLDSEIGEKIYEPIIKTSIGKDSLRMELIYTGLDANNLKVSYREYRDSDYPTNSQDLIYNLKQSEIIRYRNFQIKVLKATNESLDYVVLED